MRFVKVLGQWFDPGGSLGASALAENVRLLAAYARDDRNSGITRNVMSAKTLYEFARAGIITQFLRPRKLLHSGQWCSALKKPSEVSDATERIRRLGLQPHPDWPKNWDAFRSFSFILRNGRQDSSVLDVGTSAYGHLLSWLHLFGYRHLYGCDLVFSEAYSRGRIRYSPQDLHRTSYPTAAFDFITSLSVIEHGVDLAQYFSEMYRLLKPGGYLLTSTDYWCDPISTQGLYDDLYHCPVKIFSPQGVTEMLQVADNSGFELVEDIKLGCEEPVVYWERLKLRFTFLFLVLRRKPSLA